MQASLRAGLKPDEFWEMDPDETQMFVEAYWWRWEMEDRMQAHYAAQHLSAATGKKLKPKKVKFLAEWHDDDSGEDAKELESRTLSGEKPAVESKPSKKKRAEDDKAAFKRLKEFSKQRAREHRSG